MSEAGKEAEVSEERSLHPAATQEARPFPEVVKFSPPCSRAKITWAKPAAKSKPSKSAGKASKSKVPKKESGS